MVDNMNKFDKELCDLLRARFPFIHITTYEEERLIKEINRIVLTDELIHTPRNLYVWKRSEGFKNSNGLIEENTLNKTSALQFIKDNEEASLFVLLDFHVFCETPNDLY